MQIEAACTERRVTDELYSGPGTRSGWLRNSCLERTGAAAARRTSGSGLAAVANGVGHGVLSDGIVSAFHHDSPQYRTHRGRRYLPKWHSMDAHLAKVQGIEEDGIFRETLEWSKKRYD